MFRSLGSEFETICVKYQWPIVEDVFKFTSGRGRQASHYIWHSDCDSKTLDWRFRLTEVRPLTLSSTLQGRSLSPVYWTVCYSQRRRGRPLEMMKMSTECKASSYSDEPLKMQLVVASRRRIRPEREHSDQITPIACSLV